MHRWLRHIVTLAGGLLLAACQGSSTVEFPPLNPGVTCTLIGCGSAMSLATQVNASMTDLDSSTLRICRNDACYSLSLQGFSQGNRVYFPRYGEAADGNPSYDATIERLATGELLLRVSYSPWSLSELADGDVYTVTVQTADGRKLVDLHRSVTYQVTQPNGSNCPPVCYHTRLE